MASFYFRFWQTFTSLYGRIMLPELAGFCFDFGRTPSFKGYTIHYQPDVPVPSGKDAFFSTKVMVWVCSGVPAIFIDNTGRGYTRQLEKEHGLVFNFSEDDGDVERALDKAAWLLGRDDLREEWLTKRDTMLAGKVDLTSWMIDLTESFDGRNLGNEAGEVITVYILTLMARG